MGKTIAISKRNGYLMAAGALLIIIILWIATVREGNRLLDTDSRSTTQPTPYK